MVNANSRFDVQVKRIHEYKRQLLNAMKIIYLYHDLKNNPTMEFTPQTFFFGGKAAPRYFFAKRIIKLINSFNISQYKLCKDINISDANFAKWKKGVLPQFETLLNISQYFNCSLDYLIARSDS